ncbi:hypothetical protein AB205_0014220 [Aquarana catesbeiana]|uniref:Uncharacterized protein n=1 Tax=Aquarana catesbeiana TaxID=8400 RepID=A0A2G9RLQ5_AQUCT|nr:hypothetical protein AB205_0014220 [Aquarana catesbeiana]
MMDAIKIYGKTKEQFGWPDEPPEEFPSASVSSVCPPNLNQANGTSDGEPAAPPSTNGTAIESSDPETLTILDRLCMAVSG